MCSCARMGEPAATRPTRGSISGARADSGSPKLVPRAALMLRTVSVRRRMPRSEEHTSELQSPCNLVCRLLLEKKNWADETKRIPVLLELIGKKRTESIAMFITEIFKSIQGEGTRAGLPCVFVRLTGCNLRCTWCDTAYAFHGGKKMSVEEVLARVDELCGRAADQLGTAANVPLVELTGGEPLLQEEIYPLAEALVARGYTVM